MNKKSLITMTICAVLGMSHSAIVMADTGSESPTIENSFTFTPAPGNLDYTTIQQGFTYLSISPNSGVTPAVNEGCTEKIKLVFNDETLLDIDPKYLTFSYIDFHGGFWSGQLMLNPENALPIEKFQQAGKYEIQFPANLVQVNGENTPAHTLTYTYVAPVEGDVDFASSMSNVDGDTFYSIYVKMDNADLNLSATDDFKCEMMYEGDLAYTFDSTNVSAYGNSFTINIPSEINQSAKPGEYTFKVYPGSLKGVDVAKNIYGLNTSELSYTYTLLSLPAVESMTPENGSAVGELDEIILAFNRYMGIATPWDSAIKLQVMQNGEALDDYTVEISTVEDAFAGKQVKITIDPAITTEGEYSISNISSFLNFKLHADDAWPSYWYDPIECSFKVVPPTIENSFTFTPAPGNLDYTTMQQGFTYLSITPNSGVTPSVNADCTEKIKLVVNEETLLDIDPQYLVFTYMDFHGGFWSGQLSFNPENALPIEKFQQAGKYEIQFPANLVQVNGVNTPAHTLAYTYTAPVEGDVDFASSLSSVDGDTFYSIYVKMDNADLNLSATDDFKCEMMYEGNLAYTFDKSMVSAYGNTFTVNIPTEINQDAKPGEYTFKVYPGSLKGVDVAKNIYGLNRSELNYTYTLLPLPAVESMTPENGSAVIELDEVVLTFNRYMGIATPWDPAIKLQVMQNGEALDDYTVEISTVEEAFVGKQVKITIDPAITTDGEYSISNISSFLNFKLHTDDAWPSYWNEPVDCSFKVDGSIGVSPVINEAGRYNVYNMQGVILLKDADRDALSKLHPGIYIINGQKICIK